MLKFLKDFFSPAVVKTIVASHKDHNPLTNSLNAFYPIVKNDRSDRNGAATLATILRFYGRAESLAEVARLIPTQNNAASLRSIKNAAEKLGFSVRPVKIQVCEALLDIPVPAIAHERIPEDIKNNHPGQFIVIYRVDRDSVVVGDTGSGTIKQISLEQFCQIWTRCALLLEPKQ
jgi:ATP-binding cassette, subfamily C, bacterial